jgi:hypothetical protein
MGGHDECWTRISPDRRSLPLTPEIGLLARRTMRPTVAPSAGLEPATPGAGGQCSIR